MRDAGHEQTDAIIKDLEHKIANEYRTAQRDMQRKLNEYLVDFAAKDAVKKQELKDGKITKQEYIDWNKRHVAMGKRWENMRDVLAEDYHRTNVIARNIASDARLDVYALNHNYATYQIEHDAKIDTSYTLYDRPTVERIFRDDPKLFHDPGKKKALEIAKNKDLRWNRQQVNSAILQGILQGESIDRLAKRLESVTEKNYNAAVRNARTALTGAQNAGRLDGYKRAQDLGIDLMQEWMATLDGRTRHEHRMLHGQRVKVGEPFTVDGYKLMYPGDPSGEAHLIYNCRCTLIGQIKGFETARVESSPKMGGMTFDQWQNAKAPKTTVDFGSALSKSLGSSGDTFKKVVLKAGKNIIKLYTKYSDQLKDCKKQSGAGRYIPSLKKIEWDDSKHGDTWSTLAHEYGHFVDDVMGNSYNSVEVDFLNSKVQYPGNMRPVFKKTASSSDEFLAAMRADRTANAGFMTDDTICDRIKKDLLQNSSYSAGVQDAFDGFWGTQDSKDYKRRLLWGHGNRYYNRAYNQRIAGFGLDKDLKDAYIALGFDASNQTKVKTITRDYETSSELWANITSAETVGGEELDYMKRYFPNAVKAWEKIVGGI